jgi:hypothetical protein
MSKNKTEYTDNDVMDYIHQQVEQPSKQEDSFKLIALWTEWTGEKPKMWGSSIIGFGTYHYTYKSGHGGSAPLLGFSPRKAAFSLYVYFPTEKNESLISQLGTFTMGKSCIYVKKLSDIHIEVLQAICMETLEYLKKEYNGTDPAC